MSTEKGTIVNPGLLELRWRGLPKGTWHDNTSTQNMSGQSSLVIWTPVSIDYSVGSLLGFVYAMGPVYGSQEYRKRPTRSDDLSAHAVLPK